MSWLLAEHATLALGPHRLDALSLGGACYGRPVGDAPVTVLMGGITASPWAFGGADGGPGAGWWPALLGDGLLDPARETLLCPALPGSGTTWRGLDERSEAAARALPRLSVLELADLVAHWLDALDVSGPVRFVGASLGGLVGLALAVRHPERVDRLVSVSAGLRPDGWGTGVRHLQREVVLQALRSGEVDRGMSLARQIGMLTYRGREELDTRFGALTPDDDLPPVAAYLDHHGRRFAERFHPNAFLLLSEAIDRCRLADTPTGTRAALARIQAEVAVVGVPGDLLFPWALQQELHRELQAAGARSSLHRLESVYGHDAFLADQDRLADVLRDTAPFKGRARGASRVVEPVRVLRLGLIGCGTVGQGLLALLDQQRDSLRERYNVRFEVARIAVRDPAAARGPFAEGIPRTDDALAVVSDPGVDVIVEVAGGADAMLPVVEAALAAGKPVVTANKAMLARHLSDLAVLAHRTATPLACEASAAAALPVLRALSHRADDVIALLGIVNGTTNYVLTRMEGDEETLDQAIAGAQALGFAEADPSADIDGHDAAAKLTILAYRSFGVHAAPGTFPVRGIRGLRPEDADLAGSMGYRIRHVVAARDHGDHLELSAEPLLLPEWHLLASVEEEYNAVYLQCRHAGDLSFFGKGAGGAPTATAVLGDLIDLAQDNTARWPAPRALRIDGPGPRAHYLRVSGQAHPSLARRVEGRLRKAGLVVRARAARRDGHALHLGFLVDVADEAAVQAAADALAGLARIDDTVILGVVA